MDELAASSGMDPLEYRLKLMAPYPVATALLEKVADMSDWRSQPAEGRARRPRLHAVLRHLGRRGG